MTKTTDHKLDNFHTQKKLFKKK